jgi:general secretion pathway protein M
MVLVALVGAILYLWLILSAERARAQLLTSVTTLRAQSARLDRQALEYQHLRTAPAKTVSHTDLRTLVQARIDAAGLSRVLVRIDAVGVNQVKVVFGALPYADWLGWVASLRAQQVRLDTCRIEALSTAPGMVSVTATFTRAGP